MIENILDNQVYYEKNIIWQTQRNSRPKKKKKKGTNETMEIFTLP